MGLGFRDLVFRELSLTAVRLPATWIRAVARTKKRRHTNPKPKTLNPS